MTCRGLVKLSQRHLFEYVKVQGSPRWLRFLKTLKQSAVLGTDIGQYVRKLVMMDISIGPRMHDLFLDIVHQSGGLLRTSNVRELILQEWDWVTVADRALDYDPVSPARDILCTLLPFPQLESIVLVNNVVRYPHIIPQLLSTFVSLAKLRVDRLRLSDDALHADHLPFEQIPRNSPPVALQDLSICCDYSNPNQRVAADFLLKALLTYPPSFRLAVNTLRMETPEGTMWHGIGA